MTACSGISLPECQARRGADLIGGFGETRRPGLLPSLLELIAVKEPEDSADEEQDDLVERSRDGHQTSRTAPAKRSWDSAVSNHDLDGFDRPGDEGAHALSLGREPAPSRCSTEYVATWPQ